MMQDLIAAAFAVRQLHARYTDAVFRLDFDEFADCFTQDAVWHIAGMRLQGSAQITGFFRERTAESRFVLLTFRTPLVHLIEGGAAARTYVTEVNVRREGPALHNYATYYERFCEAGGVWRRRYAYFDLHYSGPDDFSGRFFEAQNFGPPPAMPPDDA